MSIIDSNPYPTSPLELALSDTHTFVGSNQFDVFYDYSITSYNWSIFRIDETTYSVLTEESFAELTYGLFKVVLTVSVSLTGENIQLSVQDASYLKIKPTGILVNALPNSATTLTVGFLQSFTLDPVTYSTDSDNLLQMSSLDFKFYCRLISSSDELSVYVIDEQSHIDFQTGISGNTCFNSTGKSPTS